MWSGDPWKTDPAGSCGVWALKDIGAGAHPREGDDKQGWRPSGQAESVGIQGRYDSRK